MRRPLSPSQSMATERQWAHRLVEPSRRSRDPAAGAASPQFGSSTRCARQQQLCGEPLEGTPTQLGADRWLRQRACSSAPSLALCLGGNASAALAEVAARLAIRSRQGLVVSARWEGQELFRRHVRATERLLASQWRRQQRIGGVSSRKAVLSRPPNPPQRWNGRDAALLLL